MDISLDESIRRNRKSHHYRSKNTRLNKDKEHSSTTKNGRYHDFVHRERRDKRRQSNQHYLRDRTDERHVDRNQRTTRIRITNLHYDVNESDLLELFSEVVSKSDSMKVKIDYDFSGRSNGSATVTVSGMAAAISIQNRFNNVPLDGMPMRIEILPSKQDASDFRGTSNQSTKNLDEELDVYMMQK